MSMLRESPFSWTRGGGVHPGGGAGARSMWRIYPFTDGVFSELFLSGHGWFLIQIALALGLK